METLDIQDAGVYEIDTTMTVNSEPVRVRFTANETLLEVLRGQLGLTGAKKSCDVQVCGACTVLLDGRPVSACTTLAWEARGRTVRTVEGLARDGQLGRLQREFASHGAFQCGFCTPGMLMAATALLEKHPHPSRARITEFMDGNICRCTGYHSIAEAIAAASDHGEGAK